MKVAAKSRLLIIVALMLSSGLVSGVDTGDGPQRSLVGRESPSGETTNEKLAEREANIPRSPLGAVTFSKMRLNVITCRGNKRGRLWQEKWGVLLGEIKLTMDGIPIDLTSYSINVASESTVSQNFGEDPERLFDCRACGTLDGCQGEEWRAVHAPGKDGPFDVEVTFSPSVTASGIDLCTGQRPVLKGKADPTEWVIEIVPDGSASWATVHTKKFRGMPRTETGEGVCPGDGEEGACPGDEPVLSNEGCQCMANSHGPFNFEQGMCNIGDLVRCPNSTSWCAGNECCPVVENGQNTTVPCPSASPTYHGCMLPKMLDCTNSQACADFTTGVTCFLSDVGCAWSNDTCKACHDFTTGATCTDNGCLWNVGVCEAAYRPDGAFKHKCPLGFDYIRTSAECNHARAQLGITEWNGDDLDRDSSRLPYCWLGTSSKVNFNRRGDIGGEKETVDSHLICERTLEACTNFLTDAACPDNRCEWSNSPGQALADLDGSDAETGVCKEALTVLPLTPAKEHCLKKKLCEEELVGDGTNGTYTYAQLCECAEAVANSLFTNLDCSAWENCLEKHSDLLFLQIFQRLNEAFHGKAQPQSLVLQQRSVRQRRARDVLCLDPYEVDLEKLECDCWFQIRLQCSDNGTVSLSEDAMFNCTRAYLCGLPDVCCSWKADQCPPADQCNATLLEVSDTGKAEQEFRIDPISNRAVSYEGMCQELALRLSSGKVPLSEAQLQAYWDNLPVVKENVEAIEDAMHGRRQPSTISSSEPVLLEESVSSKCGSATAR